MDRTESIMLNNSTPALQSANEINNVSFLGFSLKFVGTFQIRIKIQKNRSLWITGIETIMLINSTL